ncbi:VOC family protein [Actinomadura algeriensis]|uniref:Methylmalonyl-CoA/ethylmalonyl-CoA epimerase n=1 Tax=Actinomadura algeriensis TaxID=1679523 RepID=A0ABR9JTM7_9ACTN|nr:VOC family protein [Actinomadura algeriensis]MBE1533915.1 methylmalonyl-CoA/ethylmalonyl-CoA epimerase [Actinomadura algeriensis]
MILRIDHVGIAAADAEGTGAALNALGLLRTCAGPAADYGVTCDFWTVAGRAGDPAIEVVSPAGEDSAVAGVLARRGPGPYHVAFEVDDVRAELARLRELGCVAVDAEPRRGARPGMRVAFMYLRRPAGLLIELVEYTEVP